MTDQNSEPFSQANRDARLLELLACPACRGGLRRETGAERISCTSCGRSYPVEDGIPVLIVERAFES